MAGREKTFYFLKLEKDFFDKKEIKLLRKIAGGDTYTIIYLKMLLMSLPDEGFFYFENIGNDIAEEVAVSIEEDIENVSVTLSYLQKKGLLEIIEADKYYLNSMPEMVGQITSNALRQRRFQAKKKQRALENNAPITQNNVEIEKELELDIELDVDEDKKQSSASASNLKFISEYYQQEIGILSPHQFEQLSDYLRQDNFESEVIKIAINKAADNGKRSFGYVNSILRNWRQNGITTLVQVEEEQRNFIEQKADSRNTPSTPTKTNVPEWADKPVSKREPTEAELAKMQELKAKMLAREAGI